MKRVDYRDIDYLLCYMNQDTEEKKVDLSVLCKLDDFCIPMPRGFIKASDEYVKAKYFSKNRPQIVFKDENGESNLMLQSMKRDLVNESDDLKSAKRAIYFNDSTVRVYDEGKIIKENYTAVWFDYKNFVSNECIYNLLFIISAGRRSVFGAFNCMFENYDIWKPIVLKILKNVRIEVNNNEGILD